METLEAIFTRRSVRSFTSQRIEGELLQQVVQAGAASPSGGNLQAWGFVVVQGVGRLKALHSLAPGIIGEPVAVIVICLDTARASRLGGKGSQETSWIDAGLALENMLLAAHSLGLGACPIGSFHRQSLALFLEMPAGVQPILLLALGYPQVKPTSPGRRPLSEVVFSEKWGALYVR